MVQYIVLFLHHIVHTSQLDYEINVGTLGTQFNPYYVNNMNL